jgi:hypothetical protein
MPKRPLRAGGGTADNKGSARQAGAARNGDAGEKRTMLMEEVCARENLMNAYRRVVRNAGAPICPVRRRLQRVCEVKAGGRTRNDIAGEIPYETAPAADQP